MVEVGVVQDRQPVAWHEQRSDKQIIVVSASAYGACLRGLCANLCGFDPRPPDDVVQMRMDEGNLHEPDIIARVEKEEGWRALDVTDAVEQMRGRGRYAEIETTGHAVGQLTVEYEVLPGLLVARGHVDAVAVKGFTARVQEDKAVATDIFTGWTKKHDWDHSPQFQKYAVQLSLYMLALDLPALFAVKNRNTGEIDVTLWDEPIVPVNKLRAKALQIVAGAKHGAIPNCDREPEWGCFFRYLHVEGDEKKSPELDEDALVELAELHNEWTVLRAREKESEARRKDIQKRVYELVGEDAKVRAIGVTVSTFWQKHTTYDMDELRREVEPFGIDINDFKHETRNKRVLFTPRKKG